MSNKNCMVVFLMTNVMTHEVISDSAKHVAAIYLF